MPCGMAKSRCLDGSAQDLQHSSLPLRIPWSRKEWAEDDAEQARELRECFLVLTRRSLQCWSVLPGRVLVTAQLEAAVCHALPAQIWDGFLLLLLLLSPLRDSRSGALTWMCGHGVEGRHWD